MNNFSRRSILGALAAADVGKVDYARNEFDPHKIVSDFDSGTLVTDPDGRMVRQWEIVAVDKEVEIAPGIMFPAFSELHWARLYSCHCRLWQVPFNRTGNYCSYAVTGTVWIAPSVEQFNTCTLGSIQRGYTHPFHPVPALTLFALCAITFFAIFLGYGSQLIAMVIFYVVVSVWFHFYRYRYVRRGDQFTMPWPQASGLLRITDSEWVARLKRRGHFVLGRLCGAQYSASSR